MPEILVDILHVYSGIMSDNEACGHGIQAYGTGEPKCPVIDIFGSIQPNHLLIIIAFDVCISHIHTISLGGH